jgi:outer membrane protein assembly factor BamD (BamD/ComL family)
MEDSKLISNSHLRWKKKQKAIKIIVATFCCILLIGCAATKQYKQSVQTNTISVYENYLQKFSKSKYKPDVEQRLNVLYDKSAYNIAVGANTISSYENYLTKFSDGQFVETVNGKLEGLKKEKEEMDNWTLTKNKNKIEDYEEFINSYPNSKRHYEARTKINELKELQSWQTAQSQNTIESYTAYINQYSTGKYATNAHAKIKQMEEEKYVLPEWNKAKTKNTYKAYFDFYEQYPNSSYSSLALEKMQEIEENDWAKAQKANTVAAYKKYLSNYPDGVYTDEAKEAIIDREVDAIMAGNHGLIPPLNRVYSSSSSTSMVEIENNTSYTLTILYSGTTSRKLEIPPHKTYSVTLSNGNYRVAAKVSSPSIIPYAGNESLTGGEYSTVYYIITTTRHY